MLTSGYGLQSLSEISGSTMAVISTGCEGIHITGCSWPSLYWIGHFPTLGHLNLVARH